MNQMRTFLIVAWLMVATLLWMAWNQDQRQGALSSDAHSAAQAASPAQPVPNDLPVPAAPGAASSTQIPQAPAAAAATPAMSAPQTNAPQTKVTLSNDVLRLTLDGANVRRAELLQYKVDRKPDSSYVRLLDDAPRTFYIAQSGWSSAKGAPNHNGGFVPEQSQREIALAAGQAQVAASFVWSNADGVSIRRTYTLKRGDYALSVRDEIVNRGTLPWTGYVYRQLSRIPPIIDTSITSGQRYGFNGAAWYTPADKYQKRAYEKFLDNNAVATINADNISGGWVGLMQHYFFAGWIPQKDQKANFSLIVDGKQSGIRAVGPQFTVAPGQRADTVAQLWIGPKLQQPLDQLAPGIARVLDYGWLTVIAEPIHKLLAILHKVTGNWGWAIVLLVVLIKGLMYPLSAAQYKSAAQMRRLQPRLQQLKERYGEDKQKYQQAHLELLKKEKINPAGGCLPIFIQMPVFFALLWVLSEAIELRQAPWMLWIQDLTASDPLFILPVLNVAIMWMTQRMTPMVGMDPMQQKVMQYMPLVVGATLMFFPAGLVLYWVTNGALGMLQQWWMLRLYGDKPENH